MTQTSTNPMSLAGGRVLVAGASSGIGQATSRLAAALGAEVILVGRDQQRLAETLDKMPGAGHEMIVADVTDPEAIGRMFGRIADQERPLSGLVHAAGTVSMVPLPLLQAGQVHDLVSVTLQAGLLLSQGFARKRSHGPGSKSLVFISSVAAFRGQSGMAAYAGAKAALEGAARSLAVELTPKGIRVNCLAAGAVQTPMHQSLTKVMSQEMVERYRRRHLLGFGSADSVANAACFLLSNASAWITGTTLTVDGGYSCF
jgi:NAD(P)-dependent dehydrogenase (short-subunit alcohol dehydrogenase family)